MQKKLEIKFGFLKNFRYKSIIFNWFCKIMFGCYKNELLTVTLEIADNGHSVRKSIYCIWQK